MKYQLPYAWAEARMARRRAPAMSAQGRPVLHWWDSGPGDLGTSLAHPVKAEPTWALGRR